MVERPEFGAVVGLATIPSWRASVKDWLAERFDGRKFGLFGHAMK
jgi:hypothetical protein